MRTIDGVRWRRTGWRFWLGMARDLTLALVAIWLLHGLAVVAITVTLMLH